MPKPHSDKHEHHALVLQQIIYERFHFSFRCWRRFYARACVSSWEGRWWRCTPTPSRFTRAPCIPPMKIQPMKLKTPKTSPSALLWFDFKRLYYKVIFRLYINHHIFTRHIVYIILIDASVFPFFCMYIFLVWFWIYFSVWPICQLLRSHWQFILGKISSDYYWASLILSFF